jgi:hypothetical protein
MHNSSSVDELLHIHFNYRLLSIMMEKSITKQRLKQIDTKGQTHDQLINELIKAKRNSQDSIDSGFASLQSSESSSP